MLAATEARSPCHCTIGTIAARLRVPHHRITYAILSRGIVPVGRVGRYRVFDEEAVARIGRALAETEAATRGVAS